MSIIKVTKQTKSGKSTRWRAFLPAMGGKRESKMFASKKEAVQWKAERIAERKKIQLGICIDESSTISEFFALWMKNHVEKRREASTQRRYLDLFKGQVEPYIGHILASDLHPSEAVEWFALLSEQVADENVRLGTKTANMAIRLLKGLYNWGVRHHLLVFNPVTSVTELPEVKGDDDFDFWSQMEIQAFLNAMLEHPNYVFYLCALNTGMRLGELLGLKRDCVDFRRNIIDVRRTWCPKEERLKEKTKGKKRRVIPISSSLRTALSRHLMMSPPESHWVFFNEVGDEQARMTHCFTHRIFRPLCRKLDVRDIAFHDLRHTYASHFIMNGGSLYVLQKLLGHKSIKTTERYAHLAPDFMQGVADVVSFGGDASAQLLVLEGGEKKP